MSYINLVLILIKLDDVIKRHNIIIKLINHSYFIKLIFI